MARFGLSYKDFLQITPKEFYLSLKSKSKYDGSLIETNVKFICNTIRTQTLWLYNPIVGAKDQKTNPKRLMQFPWDDDIKITESQTKEQMKKVMKQIAGGTIKKDKK